MTDTATCPKPGLRERKKRATREALQRATLTLVAERGPEKVTVEDIAAAADVSPRTFFNYYASKEEAIAGFDPDVVDEIGAALAARPLEEPPLVALRAVLLADAPRFDQNRDLWELRLRVAKDHPALFKASAGSTFTLDLRLAEVTAERTGTDISTDALPQLTATIASATRRTALRLWAHRHMEGTYAEVLTECFDELANQASSLR